MYNKDLSILEKNIGYKFKDRNLLITALTHSSYSNEAATKGEPIRCNERLEFLGDSVLSLIVSKFIFERYKDKFEGELSKIRAATVSEKPLAGYAAQIDLGSFILLGKGEENCSGRSKPSILSDAFEALIAAIFLDSGFEAAEAFVLPFAVKNVYKIENEHYTIDYKTKLQQIVQQESGELFEYRVIEESGPLHDRKFTVCAMLNNNVIGRGSGSSKRKAEQAAAKDALTLFGNEE